LFCNHRQHFILLIRRGFKDEVWILIGDQISTVVYLSLVLILRKKGCFEVLDMELVVNIDVESGYGV